MTVKLNGNRVNLRQLRRSDYMSVYKEARHPMIARYTENVPHPYNINHAKTFIKKSLEELGEHKSYHLGIESKKTGEIIGMMSLVKLNEDRKQAEVGYWLGTKYHGKGLASESLKLLLNFSFEELGLERVYANVMRPNRPSSILLKRNGFKFKKEYRRAVKKNGRTMNRIQYVLGKKEYESELDLTGSH